MADELKGIEMFFLEDWENWDLPVDSCFIFYPCTLREDVFGMEACDKYDILTINLDKGTIEISNDDQEYIQFKITSISIEKI